MYLKTCQFFLGIYLNFHEFNQTLRRSTTNGARWVLSDLKLRFDLCTFDVEVEPEMIISLSSILFGVSSSYWILFTICIYIYMCIFPMNLWEFFEVKKNHPKSLSSQGNKESPGSSLQKNHPRSLLGDLGSPYLSCACSAPRTAALTRDVS